MLCSSRQICIESLPKISTCLPSYLGIVFENVGSELNEVTGVHGTKLGSVQSLLGQSFFGRRRKRVLRLPELLVHHTCETTTAQLIH